MSEFKKVYLCKGEEIINTLRLRNRSDFILAEKNNNKKKSTNLNKELYIFSLKSLFYFVQFVSKDM